MEKDKAKEQMQRAASFGVDQAASRLRGQWSQNGSGRCHHHSYDELARSVGLGTDRKTIEELKKWVQKNKLPEPSRPKPKGKP